MAFAKSFVLFLLFHLVLFTNYAESKCQTSFNCGRLGTLEFPLTDELGCGLFLVNCTSPPKIQFGQGGVWYTVHQRLSTNKFRVFDDFLGNYLLEKDCSVLGNSSVPNSLFSSFSISPTLNIFSCNKFVDPNCRKKIQDYFEDYRNYSLCEAFTLYYRDTVYDNNVPTDIPGNCSVIQMPVQYTEEKGDLFQLLTPEFDVEWNISSECLFCHNKGRNCGVDSHDRFRCEGKRRRAVIIASSGLGALISTSILLFLLIRRKYALLKLLSLQKAGPESQNDIELFLKNHGNLAQKRFRYSDLKIMTNSFRENLGKGGYGSVYKGKLPDGRLVAVKIMNESKENGEDFINEVASISRTSHINIVTLLGFCYEGSKRALVYDFMPNGSLDKFIRNTTEWQKLFEIAIGIARGLEYLHRGCNMRILHFDIKPHNILLDKDFNPKISDFGLAKLCPNRSSIVSMLVARGTIGYIAPEVFCRNFGEVSHKSDVYSYGMMILEITGETKNIEPTEVDRSSEIYFPQYIYKQLEMDDENGVLDGMNEDESQYAKKRKMIIVGLWCIQTDPRDRPSMSRVVEMLEGKLESLQVPPKPYLSSPERLGPSFSICELV